MEAGRDLNSGTDERRDNPRGPTDTGEGTAPPTTKAPCRGCFGSLSCPRLFAVRRPRDVRFPDEGTDGEGVQVRVRLPPPRMAQDHRPRVWPGAEEEPPHRISPLWTTTLIPHFSVLCFVIRGVLRASCSPVLLPAISPMGVPPLPRPPAVGW